MSPVIIKLRDDADISIVTARLKGCGVWGKVLNGEMESDKTRVIALEPHSKSVSSAVLLDIPGVAYVLGSSSPHPLVDAQKGRTHWIGETLLGAFQYWRTARRAQRPHQNSLSINVSTSYIVAWCTV